LIARYFTATATGSRRSVYALTKQGAAEVQLPHVPFKWKPDTVLLGNSFAAHQIALSDIYIGAMVSPEMRWRTFSVPPVPSIPIIPDAQIENATQSFFVEMDLGTEPLPVWTRKVALYLKLASSGAFREIVSHPQFAVLVVTDAEERMHLLRRHIAKQTQKLFWFQTISIIQRQGFWSASWLRSEGSALSPPGT
jgi:Replication-relaxation